MSGVEHLWTLLARAARPWSAISFADQKADPVRVAELLAWAERAAGDIVAVRGGDAPRRVGLLMANGEPWVRGLLAAWRLDGTVVPLPLPAAFGGAEAYTAHLARIAGTARLDTVLVDSAFTRRAAVRATADQGSVMILDLTALPESAPVALPAPTAPVRPAVIQFTSGSTARPKGVVLSHGNVAGSLATMAARTALTERDVLALWVPFFHDMGLFSLLSVLSVGGGARVWRPGDAIRRPLAWLADFAAAGAAGVPAPNFFYDQLVDAAAREGVPDGLDLSAWRFAINGAEPVRAETVDAFARTFAPYGLRPGVMRPAYGMAEATLMVSSGELGEPVNRLAVDRRRLAAGETVRLLGAAGAAGPTDPADADARQVVSCGSPVPGMGVRIAGGAADGTVGEVEISGPAVTAGYLDLPDAEQPRTADGWLRTGDLGFLHGGELYLTGRAKDMVIVRGQNFYAEDVEEILRTTSGVDRRVCAAFARPDGAGERMVLLWETRLHDDAAAPVADRIRDRVGELLGLAGVEVVPVPPATIPHTTSGKVRRTAALAVYHERSRP